MKLTDEYDGTADPLEGDRTIVWRSLPSNAKVTKATVTVTPVAASGGTLFEELIAFDGVRGDLGATKNVPAAFVEVDFHKRRTLASVDGTGVRPGLNTKGASLQVDLGGLYVEINEVGAVRTPDDDPFHVGSDGALPGLTVSKFKLTPDAGVPNIDVSRVVIRSAPTNAALRIGTLAPVWSRVGELSAPDTSADFSTVLQAYLPHADVVNGYYAIPVTIHSDTVARLRIDLNIEFVGQAPLQPDGLSEVLVPFDLDTRPKTERQLLAVALPAGARVLPRQTTAKVTGAFQQTRIAHGLPAGSPTPPLTVRVAPDESQAQVVAPVQAFSAVAIDVLLAATTPSAHLRMDLRRDLDGKPDGVSAIPRPIDATVKADPSQEPAWVSLPLPAEFNFAPSNRYWLVLNALEGEALWSTQMAGAGSIGVQHTLDGGLSWRYSGALTASGPLDAAFRIRTKPAVFQVPVHLQVGAGQQGVALSLDRFQPLGKLDFTIDTPEFADSFNQYLSSAASSACPQGEHLVNGNFEQWSVSGDEMGDPFSISTLGAIEVLATTSDGQRTYIAGALGPEEEPAVLTLESICDEIADEGISLPPGSTLAGMAVNPPGDRLYVSADASLVVVDPAARAVLGTVSASALAEPAGTASAAGFSKHITVSPDGVFVYLVFGVQTAIALLSVRASALDALARGTGGLAAGDVRSLSFSGSTIDAIALSPDGTRLYVAAEPATVVSVIDTAAFRPAGSIDVAEQPTAIDFTADGKVATVLTTGPRARLHLIDTASQAETGAIDLGVGQPEAVVTSPDGARAYALVSPTETTASLVTIDLRREVAGAAVSLQSVAGSMTITPQGDRLYVAGSDSGVVVIPVGDRSPSEWFVSSDNQTVPAKVVPACIDRDGQTDIVAVFGRAARPFEPNPVSAGLSQVVPVSGTCGYRLSFSAFAEDDGALANIFWLDAKAKLLRTDSVPIQVKSPERRAASPPSEARLARTTATGELPLHQARFESPAGAAQAEVRFTTPAFQGLAVADVSLVGTSEALDNTDVTLTGSGLADGWKLSADYPRSVSLTATSDGTRLLNSSAGDAELMQVAVVGANRQFSWDFVGRALQSASAMNPPSAELRWLKADGALAGPSTLLSLDTKAFARYPASGVTPENCSTVEIRLKTPPGTGIDINRTSLQNPTRIPVPLTFVSQAPGELRVSRAQLAYDVLPPGPPAIPAQGLASPTPPGSKPGEPSDCNYCSGCGTEQPIANARVMATGAGRPVTVGVCAECGSRLARPGGRLDRMAVPFRVPVVAFNAAGMRGGRPRPQSLPPLTAVGGIREGRVRQLAEVGITSLEQLANARPEEVAKAMRGVSVQQAAGMIDTAKALIASSGRPERGGNPLARPAGSGDTDKEK